MLCDLLSKLQILKWYLCIYTSCKESRWHTEFFHLPCVIVKLKGEGVSCFASECETHPW